MQLKIGVVSDFHCHNKANNLNIRESYILTDEDFPTFQDPFKSFRVLMEENPALSVDILLMPGDFANRTDLDGLKLGWDMTKEIGSLLNAKKIIPNIGNHDVDSRQKLSTDAFQFIKSLSPDFPYLDNKQNDFFWENGFLIIEEKEYRLLIINSVHSHTDQASADHGLISQESINKLEDILKNINDDKLNIAMVHHNPIEHSHYNSGSKDFMYNGDELISILDNSNFDLIIHGHKHDPRIRYSQGGGNAPVIFSSGSFCAFSNLLLQGAHNTFHIITLEIEPSEVGKGTIDTWFFVPTKGWKQEVNSPYFQATIGFGAVIDLKKIASNILEWFINDGRGFIEWSEFLNYFPELKFTIPSDLIKLKGHLKNKGVFMTPVVTNEPIFVQYKPVLK
jgi:predicted phosphodiesterase